MQFNHEPSGEIPPLLDLHVTQTGEPGGRNNRYLHSVAGKEALRFRFFLLFWFHFVEGFFVLLHLRLKHLLFDLLFLLFYQPLLCTHLPEPTRAKHLHVKRFKSDCKKLCHNLKAYLLVTRSIFAQHSHLTTRPLLFKSYGASDLLF